MTPILTTVRMIVRPWDVRADAQAVVELFGDPEVVRFIGKRLVPDVQAARPFLETRLARTAPAGLGFWAVVERETGAVIGSLNLDPIPVDATRVSPDVQFGAALQRRFWGRGLATELGVAALRMADAQGLHEVVAVVESENARSHAMIARLGFTLDGPTTRYYGGESLIRYVRRRGAPLPADPSAGAAPEPGQ